MNETLPDLVIETITEGDSAGLLMLSQDSGCGEDDKIVISPWHVRLMAEKLGFLSEMSASDANVLRTQRGQIAELTRDQRRLRLVLLAARDRAEGIHAALGELRDGGQDNMNLQVAQCGALADIVDLACRDFEDEYEVVPRDAGPSCIEREKAATKPDQPTKGGGAVTQLELA